MNTRLSIEAVSRNSGQTVFVTPQTASLTSSKPTPPQVGPKPTVHLQAALRPNPQLYKPPAQASTTKPSAAPQISPKPSPPQLSPKPLSSNLFVNQQPPKVLAKPLILNSREDPLLKSLQSTKPGPNPDDVMKVEESGTALNLNATVRGQYPTQNRLKKPVPPPVPIKTTLQQKREMIETVQGTPLVTLDKAHEVSVTSTTGNSALNSTKLVDQKLIKREPIPIVGQNPQVVPIKDLLKGQEETAFREKSSGPQQQKSLNSILKSTIGIGTKTQECAKPTPSPPKVFPKPTQALKENFSTFPINSSLVAADKEIAPEKQKIDNTHPIAKRYLKPLPPTPQTTMPVVNPDLNTSKLELKSPQRNSWNVDKSSFPEIACTKSMFKMEQQLESQPICLTSDSLTDPEESQLDGRVSSVDSEPLNVYEDIASVDTLVGQMQEESGNTMFGEPKPTQLSAPKTPPPRPSVLPRKASNLEVLADQWATDSERVDEWSVEDASEDRVGYDLKAELNPLPDQFQSSRRPPPRPAAPPRAIVAPEDEVQTELDRDGDANSQRWSTWDEDLNLSQQDLNGTKESVTCAPKRPSQPLAKLPPRRPSAPPRLLKADSTEKDDWTPRRFSARTAPSDWEDATFEETQQNFYDSCTTAEQQEAEIMERAPIRLDMVATYEMANSAADWSSIDSTHLLTREIAVLSEVVPPPEFELVHVRDQRGSSRPPPPRVLEGYPEFDPNEDERIYSHIDAHARQVAAIRFGSFRELLYALIYHRNLEDDFERVRSIFVFFGNTDFFKFGFQNVKRGSIEDRLLDYIRNNGPNRLNVRCEVIACLFEEFCSYSGLHCRKLYGYAKGTCFQPGKRFKKDQLEGHAWNAVLIHNQWRLIDVMWGGFYVDVTKQATVFELASFYFLPNPAELICDHYCNDEEWNLVPTPGMCIENVRDVPRTLAEFEDDPRHSGFSVFQCLEISPMATELVIFSEQETVLIVHFKKETEKDVFFNLFLKTSNGSNVCEGQSLDKYGFMNQEGKELHILIRLPAPEIYYIDLIGGWMQQSTSIIKRRSAYPIAKFKVDATELNASRQVVPFPFQLTLWTTEKCVLVEPLDGILKGCNYPSGWVRFRLKVPAAKKVVVIIQSPNCNSNFLPLNFTKGDWFAELNLQKYFERESETKIYVATELSCQSTNSYQFLLEYLID